MPDVSVVILTMGDRPDELGLAIESARAQQGVDVELILVINGGEPDRTHVDVVVEPGRNLGIPGGRNAGAAAASGNLILFLDDDGRLLTYELLSNAAARFANEPELAVVALRIVDEEGSTARRHLSGLRQRPDEQRDVTSFPGGGAIIRRGIFSGLDGLCEAFSYALEETDLAWRVVDHGHRISYDPCLMMYHPRTLPSRHQDFVRSTARNRVWLAHRRLPLLLSWIYPINWLLITIARSWRTPLAVKAAVAGSLEGIRTRPGPRQPIRWATVVQLARLGRPPII